MPASEAPVVNGMAVKPFEQMIAEAHGRVMDAIDAAVEAELQRILLPADRVAMLWGIAKFVPYFATIKVAEVRTPLGQPIEKLAALRAWREIARQIDREVPAMLLEFGREAEQRRVEGTGEGPTHEA